MQRNKVLEAVWSALDVLLPERNGVRLGVAVSGGPDSVALLSSLAELGPKRGLSLTVLHLNHGLRDEADREQRFVEEMAARWRLPCVVKRVARPASDSGIEAWARTQRYAFFRDAVRQERLARVALGHNQDDQAETVLLRLLRGSGRRGLAGMPAGRDGWIIRPLLGCPRRDVLTFLSSRSLDYMTDPSNHDLRYARNKIRHVLLPFLEAEFTPRIRRRLAGLADRLREEEDWLEALAEASLARVRDESGALSLGRLAGEPPALCTRILRQWLEKETSRRELGARLLNAVRALTDDHGSGPIDLGRRLTVRRQGDRLLCERVTCKPVARAFAYPLRPGSSCRLDHLGWRIVMSRALGWDSLTAGLPAGQWSATFDCDECRSPLVRSPWPGARVVPLGVAGHKKIHDVFIDSKVPRALRAGFPLIVVNERVAWVPGCVRGQPARITPTTRRVYRIEVKPIAGETQTMLGWKGFGERGQV